MNKNVILQFIILLGLNFGLVLPCYAQESLLITSLEKPIEIRPYLEIIPDPEWQYDSEAVLSGELDHLWRAAPTDGPLLAASSGFQRLWFRLRVDNQSGESSMTWHEAYTNAATYVYALASKPREGPWAFSQNWSDSIAVDPDLPATLPSARLNQSGWLAYSYPTKMEQHDTLIIGLAYSFPGFPIKPNWQWLSPEATQSALLQHTLFSVVSITTVTVLSLYYLVVFIRLRLMPFLWISALGMLITGCLMAFDKSVWLLDVWLSPNHLRSITQTALFLGSFAYLGFVASSLNSSKHSTRFRRSFSVWALILVLNCAYSLLTFSALSYIIGQICVFISLFIAWGLLYVAAVRRLEGARLIILGSVLFQIGSIFFTPPLYGLFESNILTEWGFHLGCVAELICFALFLSHHIHQYQRKASVYEDLFQSLYDSAQEGRFSWKLKSGELQHNPALCRCLDYSDTQEINLQQLNQQLALSEVVPTSPLMKKNGFTHEQELPLNPNVPSEEQHWIHLSLSYRPATPFFPEAIEGVVQDITDRKQRELSEQRHAFMLFSKLEAEQRANEAMRAAAKAKDEFLSTMSHELRTPLTSIIGFTEILRDQEELNQSDATCIESVISESQHLLTIVDDVLQISLINENKLTLSENNLCLADWLHSIKAEYQSKALQQGLTLQVSLEPTLPEQIQIDVEKYQQIIRQLLNNAIKFTPAGEVSLALSKTTEQELHVTITDTGIGMDSEAQKNCFNAFTQADSSHQRAYGGTGVGLYIAHTLATKLGGNLNVHSTPNEGSCFNLRLPYKTVEEINSPKQTHKNIDEPCLKGQVLYVEDNPNLQALVRLLVKRTGAEIECVSNGQEALTLIEQQPKRFDLILMDLQMPVLSGFEATQRLRQNGCTIPVVAFSASALEEIQPSSLDKFDAYLGKPVDKTKLKEILIRYLEPSNPIAPAAAG